MRVGPEGVSPSLLEAILREVGYADPYELINHWSKADGPLAIVKGAHGDSNYRSRRYALASEMATSSSIAAG